MDTAPSIQPVELFVSLLQFLVYIFSPFFVGLLPPGVKEYFLGAKQKALAAIESQDVRKELVAFHQKNHHPGAPEIKEFTDRTGFTIADLGLGGIRACSKAILFISTASSKGGQEVFVPWSSSGGKVLNIKKLCLYGALSSTDNQTQDPGRAVCRGWKHWGLVEWVALDHAALVALDPSITLDQSLHIFMPAFVKDMLSQDDVEKLLQNGVLPDIVKYNDIVAQLRAVQPHNPQALAAAADKAVAKARQKAIEADTKSWMLKVEEFTDPAVRAAMREEAAKVREAATDLQYTAAQLTAAAAAAAALEEAAQVAQEENRQQAALRQVAPGRGYQGVRADQIDAPPLPEGHKRGMSFIVEAPPSEQLKRQKKVSLLPVKEGFGQVKGPPGTSGKGATQPADKPSTSAAASKPAPGSDAGEAAGSKDQPGPEATDQDS